MPNEERVFVPAQNVCQEHGAIDQLKLVKNLQASHFGLDFITVVGRLQ
jgi:hypothetical protein